MHDSFTPLGGMVPLGNIMTGEVIFGGVGAGLYGMLMYAIIAVFIAGLMVGRTPEYLGKKIEQYEVKMAMLAVLVLAADILCFTALSANLNLAPGSRRRLHDAQKRTSEAAHAWSPPGTSPNGAPAVRRRDLQQRQQLRRARLLGDTVRLHLGDRQQRLGLRGHHRQYALLQLTLGIAMLIGRFLMIIPLLAIAGSLAKKKHVPETAGTFPTDIGHVHGPAGRHGRHRRRADFLPGALAGPDRGALPDARRKTFLANRPYPQ